MVFDEVLKVLEQFAEQELNYVLIGGAAMNLHGIVRATEDIDLFIEPEPENIEKLRQALKAVFDDPDIDDITDEDLTGEYSTVRYIPPKGTLYFDILTRLGKFAAFKDLKIEVKDIEGVSIKLATPETLYWLKKETLRLIDQADAEALRKKFNLEDN